MTTLQLNLDPSTDQALQVSLATDDELGRQSIILRQVGDGWEIIDMF